MVRPSVPRHPPPRLTFPLGSRGHDTVLLELPGEFLGSTTAVFLSLPRPDTQLAHNLLECLSLGNRPSRKGRGANDPEA